MELKELVIGRTFWCSGQPWRCTDIGTRTAIAIRLNRDDDPSWYNGPPYAIAETVFDEYDFKGCTPEPHCLAGEGSDDEKAEDEAALARLRGWSSDRDVGKT